MKIFALGRYFDIYVNLKRRAFSKFPNLMATRTFEGKAFDGRLSLCVDDGRLSYKLVVLGSEGDVSNVRSML